MHTEHTVHQCMTYEWIIKQMQPGRKIWKQFHTAILKHHLCAWVHVRCISDKSNRSHISNEETSNLLKKLLKVEYFCLFCKTPRMPQTFFLSSFFLSPLYYTSSWLYPALSSKGGFLRGKSGETGGDLTGGPWIRRRKRAGKRRRKEKSYRKGLEIRVRKVWKEAKTDNRVLLTVSQQISHL